MVHLLLVASFFGIDLYGGKCGIRDPADNRRGLEAFSGDLDGLSRVGAKTVMARVSSPVSMSLTYISKVFFSSLAWPNLRPDGTGETT